MNIAGKMTVLAVAGVVALGAITAITGTLAIRETGQAEIREVRERMLESKKEKLKDLVRDVEAVLQQAYEDAHDPAKIAELYRARLQQLVDTAYAAIQTVYNDPNLDEAEKMERAKAVVKGLRYGKSGYFWINDTHPTMVMHPIKPALDGKDLTDFKDPNGKRLFVEFVKACESAEGAGFVDYLWPKPGHDEPVPKLSYVKLFKPWGWIVGTGVYLEAAEERIQKDMLHVISHMRYGPEGKDYFWVNDMNSVVLMHPIKPELDGKDLSDLKDKKGTYIFREFVKACREKGEGFVPYLWPKPGHDEPVQKISYVKLFKPWGWVVGTGVYVDDVDAKVAEIAARVESRINRQVWTQVGAIVLVTLIAGFLTVAVSRKISRPIQTTTAMLQDVAQGEGDLTKRLDVQTQDEVGEMARWFNTFVEKVQHMIREVKENAEVVGRSSQSLTELAAHMSEGADDMFSRSNTVAAAAEEMSSNMANVAAAMEEATTNLGVISTAVEQMTSTIREIAQNTEKASTVTSQAVTVARSASEKVDELGNAAQLIGKVTDTINEISEQTKLLALNATIEAARAGEAGKGFAVVANEIKELARQTAAATGEIRERVEGIQGSTSATVTEIAEITRVIEEVNEIVTTIAAAVEEQSSTTREIADNVTQAARGVEEVNTNVAQTSQVSQDIAREIADVNHAASEMSNSTSQVSAAAEDLSQLAAKLLEMMGRFKV